MSSAVGPLWGDLGSWTGTRKTNETSLAFVDASKSELPGRSVPVCQPTAVIRQEIRDDYVLFLICLC